jgi:RNA polymerase sigma factor (sigma-70 family)
VATNEVSAREDGDLVIEARAGDKDAFALLVDRHRPMVLALAQQLLDDPVIAADAVQEAAVTALVGLHQLRCPERFRAWFAGIALNVARRWLRSTRASTELPDDWADDDQGPAELAEAAELAAQVQRAVRGLPRGQREAVLAFYWQGLSHAEAAAELAISPGAVKSRLHQARAALVPELVGYAERRKEPLPVTAAGNPDWVEVKVTEVRRSNGEDPTRRQHAVLLEEVGGDRRLPIYIGAPEAVALACSLEAVETPRPMTYAFAAEIARASGSRIMEVRITRLAEYTFYAVVVVDGPLGRGEVDARPSDALNLALVCGASVMVDATLFANLDVSRFDAWQRFPTGARELATEVRERDAELRAGMSAAGTPPP